MNSEQYSKDSKLYHGITDPALYSAITKIVHNKLNDETGRPSRLPENMVETMAYVPLQFYTQDYSPDEGFEMGTIFPELKKPFTAGDMKW